MDLRRVDIAFVFNAWIEGITKTGTEQEQVDKLADVLDSLLSIPEAKKLPALHEYDLIRALARDWKPHGPGIQMFRGVLLDLSYELARRKIVHPAG